MRAARVSRNDATFASLTDKGTTLTIPLRSSRSSTIRVFRPATPPAAGSPLIVLIYGGGFVTGDERQLSVYAGPLARLYGATVVNLSYRLAPEHRFPAAPDDVWDSLLWVAEHAGELGADVRAGFVVGGVSAGANLAAVCAQRWADESRAPAMTGAWLSVPLIFFHEEMVPPAYRDVWLSREQNKDADVINAYALEQVQHHVGFDHASPLCSPFNSVNPAKHATMPPRVYFQVCGQDPLRDDGLVYERVLSEAGVQTRLDVYPGVPHAHFSLVPGLESSKRCSRDTVENFAWLLRIGEAGGAAVRESVAPPASA